MQTTLHINTRTAYKIGLAASIILGVGGFALECAGNGWGWYMMLACFLGFCSCGAELLNKEGER